MKKVAGNPLISFYKSRKIYSYHYGKIKLYAKRGGSHMQTILKYIYEGVMILLVMMTILTMWREETVYHTVVNWVVWGIFFADFLVRFVKAKIKWRFIKENPFLVIAIIPFDQVFQTARIVRLFYFFRLKTVTKYYISPYIEKLTYRSRTLISSILVFLLMAEAYLAFRLEDSIASFHSGLQVVIGYFLFFGRTIYEIENGLLLWLLLLTNILGVVMQGVALQWVLSKIEEVYKS
jgi:voltage-gated potassium channel